MYVGSNAGVVPGVANCKGTFVDSIERAPVCGQRSNRRYFRKSQKVKKTWKKLKGVVDRICFN